ncbi:SagB/ThcOx family dehydrogenase [candidate division WOR-3 bacterium]|nr:SagB/ThcOx family dehydrogenase [candidate division WOR-3 bacterium]
MIDLPKPLYKSKISVEESLKSRRSIRAYRNEPLTITEISQLLWATQGITVGTQKRTAPSAGATYPLEIYVVVGDVKHLEHGLYHYNPRNHTIIKEKEGDLRGDLVDAAMGADMIRKAPISLIVAAIYSRTTDRYGERGIRYVYMEVGHVGQNIHLQAETLGLGTVIIGAFYDNKVKEILGIREEPLYIVLVGRKVDIYTIP